MGKLVCRHGGIVAAGHVELRRCRLLSGLLIAVKKQEETVFTTLDLGSKHN
jgi:hypothetical protein